MQFVSRGRNLGEKSRRILKTLYHAGVMTAEVLLDTRDYDRRIYYAMAKTLYNLDRHGYIRRRNKNNQSFFHLTPKGKLAVLKYLHLEKLRLKRWDKRWRVVIFDLPEEYKKVREYLRGELKNLGFLPMQKSVYVTPYPVTKELDQLLREYRVRRFFRYLTVSEIDNDAELKAAFNLK